MTRPYALFSVRCKELTEWSTVYNVTAHAQQQKEEQKNVNGSFHCIEDIRLLFCKVFGTAKTEKKNFFVHFFK